MAQDNPQSNSKAQSQGPSKIRHLKFGSSNLGATENFFEEDDRSEVPIYSVETALPKDESYYNSRRPEVVEVTSNGLVTKNVSLKDDDQSQIDLGKKTTKQFASDSESIKNRNSNSEKNFSFPKKDVNKVSGNSLSSIFYKDHQEISGIRRVFQKSIVFLILNLTFFGLLNFVGLNLFYLTGDIPSSLIWGIVTAVITISISNLFYIVLADRSYFWLNLVGQIIILIAIQGFVGRGLEPVTLVVLSVVILMSYLAYSELEKAQLGSRLFTIPNIIGESTRILSWVTILIICLGTFNQIIAKGTDSSGKFVNGEQFFSDVFLSKDNLIDTFFIGSGNSLTGVGLNNFLMSRGLAFQNDSLTKVVDGNRVQATFRDFLNNNYKPTETLITNNELEDIEATCLKNRIENCDLEVQKLKDVRLESWRLERYKDLPLTLDSKLTTDSFRLLTRQYYTNSIRDITTEKDSSTNFLPSVPIVSSFPASYVLPGFFVFILAILLTLIRFLVHFLVMVITWIVWSAMKLTGFVRIEVENVEAEVVSI